MQNKSRWPQSQKIGFFFGGSKNKTTSPGHLQPGDISKNPHVRQISHSLDVDKSPFK